MSKTRAGTMSIEQCHDHIQLMQINQLNQQLHPHLEEGQHISHLVLKPTIHHAIRLIKANVPAGCDWAS